MENLVAAPIKIAGSDNHSYQLAVNQTCRLTQRSLISYPCAQLSDTYSAGPAKRGKDRTNES